jgi:hypothetical protein
VNVRALRDRLWNRWALRVRLKERASDDFFIEIGPAYFPLRFVAEQVSRSPMEFQVREVSIVRADERPVWLWLKEDDGGLD